MLDTQKKKRKLKRKEESNILKPNNSNRLPWVAKQVEEDRK